MENTVAVGMPAAPVAVSDLPDVADRPPPNRLRAPLRLFCLSLLAFGLTLGLVALGTGAERAVGALGFGLAALLGLAGAMSALAAVFTAWSTLRFASIVQLLFLLAGNGVMTMIGALATFFSVADFRRGRQLRRLGKVLLPPLDEAGAWAKEQHAVAVEPALRAPLARQWRENGRTEHASVAAFSRLSLDLLTLGAPPALVACAQRDALDEIRHAELCFSLARAIDGEARGPGPFAAVRDVRPLAGPRGLALARLAVDSLVDGALHEGVSARVLARLAKRTQVAPVRALLKQLAADEGRHAAHGWDVVAWCVAEGGTSVVDALEGAVAALPRTMVSPLPREASAGAWERYGIHGHALEAEEYARARSELARRVRALREGALAA